MNPNLKLTVLSLKELSEDEIFEALSKETNLTREEKNLIYLYLYPRPLLHMELPYRIGEIRKEMNTMLGHLEPNIPEITLIIEAFKSVQYGRFIKHLMYSFTTDSEVNVLENSNKEQFECSICNNPLLGKTDWDIRFGQSSDSLNKNKLAIGSSGSKLCICPGCLIQLSSARDILENLEIEPVLYKIRP